MPDGPEFPPRLADALARVPFTARPVWRDPRFYWALMKSGLDFVAHNLPRWHRVLLRLNPYPSPWTQVRVPVREDACVLHDREPGEACPELSAWYAPGRPGAPAVLYAPGTFQTKDDSARKLRALHLNRVLGCHVLVVDLRGFGGSHAHLGSGGWLEAHDVLDSAKWLSERAGTRRIVVTGDSLGGASALIAASLPGAEDVMSAVMAWSPFADLESQMRYATTHPGSMRDPFFVPYKLYRLMVRVRSAGEARDFNDFLALRARELGVDVPELLRLASPVTHVERVRVPTLVHHAGDDPIVPVEQARRLAGAARGNPLVRVRVLPEGGHAQFDHWCEEWYWNVVQAVLEHSHDAPTRALDAAERERADDWRAGPA